IMAIALLFMPHLIQRKDYLLKSVLMLLSALIIAGVGIAFNTIGLVPCLVLILIFALAMFENVKGALDAMKSAKETDPSSSGEAVAAVSGKKEIVINIAKFVVGAAMIVGGAKLLVESGSALATNLHVPERIISVTLVAIGTSLPELVTTVAAIVKKQASLSVGNIIGANIFDLSLIMPVACLISGKALPVNGNSMRFFDLPAAFILGCVAVIPTLITKKFARWQGILLLVLYAVYLFLSLFVTV
ncbi:MAG: sodium:calcium antiporter, partial [Clostridia bacterium]|nr:sodium:calcium antiporter [Clostridia bacterium]